MIIQAGRTLKRSEPNANLRTRTHSRRDSIERLLLWAEHLAPAERSLVRCAYDWGIASTEIALLTGLTPRVIRNRLRRLLERVNQPLFRQVAMSIDTLPEPCRAVGELVILHGFSHRAAGARLKITQHRVRAELRRIEHACRKQTTASAAPTGHGLEPVACD